MIQSFTAWNAAHLKDGTRMSSQLGPLRCTTVAAGWITSSRLGRIFTLGTAIRLQVSRSVKVSIERQVCL